eukprot:TRINITY_DN40725_c0_g1_i1.p1 TRINITY_DN40725_c0_g1~~TRINITY_DN40725_c0_g1_i1.p1  ORF type:complete len:123 (-),score=26.15 TRINITY_DN40725_c0_g1_i1:9-377(-)
MLRAMSITRVHEHELGYEARWTGVSCRHTPRAYHTAVWVGKGAGTHASNSDRLWVFGGFNDDGEDGEGEQGPIRGLEVLRQTDGQGWVCDQLETVGPEARFGHSCCLLKSRLVVAGLSLIHI